MRAICAKYNLFHFFFWEHLLENIGNNYKMMPILYWTSSYKSIDELNKNTAYTENLISGERYEIMLSAEFNMNSIKLP